jgi:cytochrome c
MRVRTLLVSSLLPFLTGCGSKSADPGATPSASSTAVASVSKYDGGPRAGEGDIDRKLVTAGERVFQDKGCSACHAFGRRLSGPDLAGVTKRRTQQWMENQILHPEVMAKEDPISKQLVGVHALQMPNQGLSPEQAQAVIEYLKHKDHEASEGHESSEDAQEKGN